MNSELEQGLRAALEEIVHVDPPRGIAARAIASGKRRRRLVRGGVATVAVAVAATITLTVSAVRLENTAPPLEPTSDPTLVPTPAPTLGPSLGPIPAPTSSSAREKSLVVLIYAGLSHGEVGPAQDYSLVLDPSTGQYERLPYHTVVPSPDGTLLFVQEGDNGPQYPTRLGILDRATGTLTRLPGSQAGRVEPRWSPDGSTVLLTEVFSGYLLVDVATLQQTFVPMDLHIDNSLGLRLAFAPDGALLRVRSVGSGSEADPNVRLSTIERYTRDGELIGSVPLAIENVRWAVISADGSKLAVNLVPELGRSSIAIISTVDGSIISTIDNVPAVPPLWVDDEVLISYSGVVVTLDGTVVGQMPLPPDVTDPGLRSVVVGPATGLPASADHLRF